MDDPSLSRKHINSIDYDQALELSENDADVVASPARGRSVPLVVRVARPLGHSGGMGCGSPVSDTR